MNYPYLKIRVSAKVLRLLVQHGVNKPPLRVMPPARLGRTAVPHGGNPQDRTASPFQINEMLTLYSFLIFNF
jgi:hypothetical protein